MAGLDRHDGGPEARQLGRAVRARKTASGRAPAITARLFVLAALASGLAACQTAQPMQQRYARVDGRPVVGRLLERAERDRAQCDAEVEQASAGQPPPFFRGPVGAAKAAVTLGLREKAKTDLLAACMARLGYREVAPPA